jgi:hypothetical protein
LAKESRPEQDLARGLHSLTIPAIEQDDDGYSISVSCDRWEAANNDNDKAGTLRIILNYPGRDVVVEAVVSGGNIGRDGLPAKRCRISGTWPGEARIVDGVERRVAVRPNSMRMEFDARKALRSTMEVETLKGLNIASPVVHHSVAYVRDTGRVTGDNVDIIPGHSFASLPSAGNAIILSYSIWRGSDGASVDAGDVVDNQSGNTYTRAVQSSASGATGTGRSIAGVFYAVNIASPSGTFTVTADPDGSGNYTESICVEYSGIATSSPVRAFGTARATSTSPSVSASTPDSPVAGDLAVGVLTVSESVTNVGIDTPSGYTNRAIHQDPSGTIALSSDDDVSVAGGTETVSWGTLAGSYRWAAAIAVFKAASGGTSAISGTSSGVATTSASLTGRGALSGTSNGVATVAGDMVRIMLASGTASGAGTVTGALVGLGALSGTSSGAATVEAILAGLGALSGSSAGTATVTGSVLNDFISGLAQGLATVTGNLTGVGALSGSVAGLATAEAIISALGVLAGASSGLATVAGLVNGLAALSGTSNGLATVAGALAGLGALSGSSTGSATVTGSLLSEFMTGLAQGLATVSGNLTGVGSLSGVSNGAASTLGALTGIAAISGQISSVATAEGLLVGIGSLAGLVSGSASVSALLGAIAGISGSASGQATATGYLNYEGEIVQVIHSIAFSSQPFGIAYFIPKSIGSVQITSF